MEGNVPLRKRMKRREIEGGLRHITFSCQRRLPLLSKPPITWTFTRAMASTRARSGLRLIAWVVMPEHVQMIARPAEGRPLGTNLAGMKMSAARHVIARWQSLDAPILARLDDGCGNPRFWQKGGGFDRNVRDDDEMCREIRYIHLNPVKRGLVARAEEWKWSSVRWWMGMREGEIECDPPPPTRSAGVVGELERVCVMRGCEMEDRTPRHRDFRASLGGTGWKLLREAGASLGGTRRCHPPERR